MSRYEIDELPGTIVGLVHPHQLSRKMLELKIGTKHIYAGKYMVDYRVQNAQYCLAVVLLHVEIESQIGILERDPP